MSQYEIKNELGSGAFGTTYLAYDKVNNRDVAVKMIDVQKAALKDFSMDAIQAEITALSSIAKNPGSLNIATYYDSFDTVINGITYICIVSEYIEGQVFYDFMRNNPDLSPEYLWPIMYQLLNGLKFIHDKGFAHRDVKPENIIITKEFVIKYIDFGLACSLRCTGTRGTLLYMSPEMITGDNSEMITVDNKEKLKFKLQGSKAHDVWSLACVMFELTNGVDKFPFTVYDDGGNELPTYNLKQQIAKAPEFKSNYTLDDGRTNKFIDSLLINDWTKRPYINQAFINFINNIYTADFYQGDF